MYSVKLNSEDLPFHNYVPTLYLITDYGLNSILYQRGLYPAETFKYVQQWGLTMLVTTDNELQTFLDNILSQVKSKYSYDEVVHCKLELWYQ